MAFHQTALVLALPGRLYEDARRSHIGAVYSGPKGPDDPVDGIDEDVGAVVAGGDLVQTVAWSK